MYFGNFFCGGEEGFLLGFLGKRLVVVVFWWSIRGKKCGKGGKWMCTFGNFIFPQVSRGNSTDRDELWRFHW